MTRGVGPGRWLLFWSIALGGAAFDLATKSLELNDIGATEMIQVHGRGLLTPETRQFLKRRADRAAHAWVDAL